MPAPSWATTPSWSSTPAPRRCLPRELIDAVRGVTDRPIRHVLLTHYHAVRVLGASAYGADQIIASRPTYDLIVERGKQDYASEVQRFPRLFQAVDTIPGLTWPTMSFDDRLVMWLGRRRVELIQIGRGHTKGDTVAWLPEDRVLYAGDLVENGAAPYCGDTYFTDWPATLERLAALGAEVMVPGRGEAVVGRAEVLAAIRRTQRFLTTLWDLVVTGVAQDKPLGRIYAETYEAMKPEFGGWVIFGHCMPFNVARALDEAHGITHPRIWTAERDPEMWDALNS